MNQSANQKLAGCPGHFSNSAESVRRPRGHRRMRLVESDGEAGGLPDGAGGRSGRRRPQGRLLPQML